MQVDRGSVWLDGGCYVVGSGAVMLRNHYFNQFRVMQKFGLKNKDTTSYGGCMASTSHERVGRGRNARFHTFQLDHHGQTD